jgi:prevent-host-death family protein
VAGVEKAINVHDAKTHLSRLLERVEAGEEITLARAGRPVARLVPYRRPSEPRVPGLLKGRIELADDWDAPEVNSAIAALFDP